MLSLQRLGGIITSIIYRLAEAMIRPAMGWMSSIWSRSELHCRERIQGGE